MITKKIVLSGFEYFNFTNSISIHKDLLFYENDELISRNRIETGGFCPDQLEALTSFVGGELPALISFAELVWTADVIEQYKSWKQQQENI